MVDYFSVAFWLFSLIILSVFVSYLIGSANRAQKLKKVANDFGFEFIDTAPESIIMPLKERITLFSRGQKRFVRNMLQGKMETLPIKIFDFEYWLTINGTDHEIKTILWIELKDKTTPQFSIRAQNWLDHFGQSNHTGQKLIIVGDGAEWIKARLDKQAMAYFEEISDLNVEAFSNHVIVYFDKTGSSHNLLKADKEMYQKLIATGSFLANLLSNQNSI